MQLKPEEVMFKEKYQFRGGGVYLSQGYLSESERNLFIDFNFKEFF